MPYRITVLRSRVYRMALVVFYGALVITRLVVFGGGLRPGTVAFMCLIAIPVIWFARRGWRSATLIASDSHVTIRSMSRTMTMPWPDIDQFAAKSLQAKVLGFIPVQRRVLGVRLRSGHAYWYRELACREAAEPNRIDVSVARLNELCAVYAPQGIETAS
jgi:hypothetical protein